MSWPSWRQAPLPQRAQERRLPELVAVSRAERPIPSARRGSPHPRLLRAGAQLADRGGAWGEPAGPADGPHQSRPAADRAISLSFRGAAGRGRGAEVRASHLGSGSRRGSASPIVAGERRAEAPCHLAEAAQVRRVVWVNALLAGSRTGTPQVKAQHAREREHKARTSAIARRHGDLRIALSPALHEGGGWLDPAPAPSPTPGASAARPGAPGSYAAVA
jgi:hypothetical protein